MPHCVADWTTDATTTSTHAASKITSHHRVNKSPSSLLSSGHPGLSQDRESDSASGQQRTKSKGGRLSHSRIKSRPVSWLASFVQHRQQASTRAIKSVDAFKTETRTLDRRDDHSQSRADKRKTWSYPVREHHVSTQSRGQSPAASSSASARLTRLRVEQRKDTQDDSELRVPHL